MLIAHEVCKALGHAARASPTRPGAGQIVHRDVSPHNVLVGVDGAVRVLDFGVAKAIQARADTRPGTLKGKFAYMSPEQVDGESATHRSDLFSLGVVMWELLTARRLFKTDSQVRTLKAVQSKHAEPPSLKAEGIPRDLDAVVLRLLEKDPTRRFQDAASVLEALDDAMTLLPRARNDSLGRFMDRIFYRERAEDRARIESGKLKVLRGEILPDTPGKEQSRPSSRASRRSASARRSAPRALLGRQHAGLRDFTPTKGRSFALLLDRISQYYAHAEGDAAADPRPAP
jgi:serine/threonine-protein kinase